MTQTLLEVTHIILTSIAAIGCCLLFALAIITIAILIEIFNPQ